MSANDPARPAQPVKRRKDTNYSGHWGIWFRASPSMYGFLRMKRGASRPQR